MATRITTTVRGDYNAMRFQGILVTDNHAQLSALLENNLTREHALLFAEPAHEASGASTDWYTAAEGEPVPLLALTPEEQSRAKAKIAALASDIDRLAEGLKADGDAAKALRGNILSLALRYPGPEHMYLVGGRPVLACWGFEPGTAGARPEELMRLGMAAPLAASAAGPAPAVAPAAAPAGFPWWRALLYFLLGLLLLSALFFLAGLLFGPSGCAAPGHLPAGCSPLMAQKVADPEAPAVADDLVTALTAEQEKEHTLRGQLAELRRLLEARAAQCVREPAPEPPGTEAPVAEPAPEPVEDPAPAEEPPTLDDLMPTTPEAPPAPKKKARPAQQPGRTDVPGEDARPQKQASGEEMRIPDSAKKNKDVSFLEGCWTSESGLSSSRGEPVTVQYCFDAKGNGSRTITLLRSKDRCVGSVRADFDPLGALRINADSSPCAKGGGFVPHYVECTQGSGNKAQCYGREKGGRNNRWDAKFRRQ